ncbi:pyrroline-5-carboxylate reductase [Oceanobacillus alkalisoli]|uniref:pyrroline-5-carboxylate reductase n=1 Tax=Oceanobacillus alkalisoli TaxID=2925113 RepID=UPI001F11B5D2|nr:pyrroline-5-carboxylate reductase [Oceanobacillus alkalisoli]MCF3944023.1 pyrroline-5-carboxylate reductase [Oceanobacillus alkalisoli]
MRKRIVFVGCGSMAEAIMAGILQTKTVDKNDIYVTNKQDEERLNDIAAMYGVQTSYDKEELLDLADVVILAMKPKDLTDSISEIRSFIREDQLVISIIAGIMTETIEKIIGKRNAVIRAMPNTSAQIGYSATAIAGGKYVDEEKINFTKKLFQSIGITKVVNEADMHTVTAVSGSGPAFVYYFVEAMTKAALEAGMEASTADALITQTIIGAGKMLEQSGQPASTLRENITSEGGTTAAGLQTLKSNDFEEIIIACIESARLRSIDLGKTF